jgi:alpha-1,2-mannosyltransferase
MLDALRSGDYLTRERMRFVALALLAAYAAAFVFMALGSNGLSDAMGRPLGTDFSNVYAAGTYAVENRAPEAFDPARQYAREQAIFGAATPFYGWHYPPIFLFVAEALAVLPYVPALILWQAVTLVLYLLAIRTILAAVPSLRRDPLWFALALAFPAVFVNLGHGHNGFLTAALIGAGLALLDRRPIAAGILFGLLAYKPQFGVLIPPVLAASGRWQSFVAAAATVAVLLLATTFTFGEPVWEAFLQSTHFTRTVVLESGGTGWHKIQSVFALVRMWGGQIALAYAVQTAVTVALAAAMVVLWRRPVDFSLQAAALIIASILATPYSLDYDMMVLAPAIAFLASHGLRRGWMPYERTALAALWLAPLIARAVAEATFVPLGVLAMTAALGVVLRRAAAPSALADEWQPVRYPQA